MVELENGRIPEKASPEDVIPWVQEVLYVKRELAKNLKAPKDFVDYYNKTGRTQFIVNPIARKAFIIQMIQTLGVSDPRLDIDLVDSLYDMMDRPVVYMEEILRPFKKEGAKPKKIDFEAQRLSDLKRVIKALSDTIESLYTRLSEDEEAWTVFMECAKPKDSTPGILGKQLFEGFMRQPRGLDKLFSDMRTWSPILGAFISTDNIVKLRFKLWTLRKELELVHEGLLLNPTI